MPTDVTYEGLFDDYSFETGANYSGDALFCPTYSTDVSDDPLTGKPEYFLSVGLASGLNLNFARRTELISTRQVIAPSNTA